jgi:hypothetical protein
MVLECFTEKKLLSMQLLAKRFYDHYLIKQIKLFEVGGYLLMEYTGSIKVLDKMCLEWVDLPFGGEAMS